DSIMFSTVALGTVGSVGLIGAIFLLLRRDARRSETLAEMHSGALLESEQRFRQIFVEGPIGKVLAQSDGQRIVRANPAFCRMLGYDEIEMVGKTLSEIAHVDDRDLLTDAVRRVGTPDRSEEHTSELQSP